MRRIIHSALICACISLSINAQAHKVIGISDGDTMTLLVDNKPLKIRLANIDAPEKKQAYGQKSKESLSELCWETDATYQTQTIDRYDRTVAVVFCNGKEANREQVERGFAWVYTQYNKDISLLDVEKIAQSNKRGLWADKDAQAPWEYRKNQRPH